MQVTDNLEPAESALCKLSLPSTCSAFAILFAPITLEFTLTQCFPPRWCCYQTVHTLAEKHIQKPNSTGVAAPHRTCLHLHTMLPPTMGAVAQL